MCHEGGFKEWKYAYRKIAMNYYEHEIFNWKSSNITLEFLDEKKSLIIYW